MRDLKELTLIKGTSSLEGTTYIEFLPGIYNDKCWNESSVYIDAEHLEYRSLEDLFEEHLKDFDAYSFCAYSKHEWLEFLEILNNDNSKKLPQSFKQDFSEWIQETLKNHDKITFMGL